MTKSQHNTQNPFPVLYIAKRPEPQPLNNSIYRNAFNYGSQPGIITITANAHIVSVNNAACKLLGYNTKELSCKTRDDIFVINDRNYKTMLRQRKATGQGTAFLTLLKKNGMPFPCLVTSAVFTDTDGIEKAITNLVDLSVSILKQKSIDEANGKIVAGNVMVAMSKSNKEKLRYEKLAEERTAFAMKLKERQIAEATQDAKDAARSDIGKELHDNINQLLGASRMYIEMAKRGGPNCKMYLSRSSEYTLTAIEEIRKLTKGLTTDTIINLGLSDAIENITLDTMEMNGVKICYSVHGFIENSVDKKFKLNIYRIVQEQLNNILKHAKAKKVTIMLSQNSHSIMLSVTDNGVGFDTAKKQKGIGVDNIKSRAAHYNGTACFTSQPGHGCKLEVVFPLPATFSGIGS